MCLSEFNLVRQECVTGNKLGRQNVQDSCDCLFNIKAMTTPKDRFLQGLDAHQWCQ
jgi:hypothetical protein